MKKSKIISKALVLPLALGLMTNTGLAAPRTNDNAAWNVNYSQDGSNPAGYYGQWEGHNYFPSPNDWRTVPMYQFITDRFADGDPSNNEGKYGGYDLYKVDARHGGDFKGIADKLDYIKSLGYTAIWISPVFQNRCNSYHGYGEIDFTLVDDRFGTIDDFREMVDAAHSKGMYVIVDMIVNHMSDLYYFEGHQNEGAPFRLHNGEYRLVPRDPNETYQDFTVDNTFIPEGQYCDVYDSQGNKKTDSGMGTGSFWNSDFHHNGDLTDYGDAWCNHLGKIYGSLDDLRTTHPRVQDKIIAMTKSLIATTDIDGIRMDTPMQVPLYFFKRWAPAVKDYAASLGKDNFFIFGEFYCDRGRGATMVGRGKEPSQWGNPYSFIDNTYTMDGGINYQMYFNFFMPAIKDQAYGKLNQCKVQYDKDKEAYDFWDPQKNESRYTMLNFYDNHDQWRMASANDGFKKSNLASSVIALWPGVPLFYYGDEQGFSSEGTALGGISREDFMSSVAWYDINCKTGTNPAVKDNFDMCNPSYQYVQKIMNLRRQYPALQNTDELYERWCQPDAGNGVYVYSRVWGDQKNWAMVAFNTWSDNIEAKDFHTGWNEGDEIVNAMNPTERYRLGENGKMSSLWVGPYETKVFVRADNLQSLDPVVTSVTPEHDNRVNSDTQTISVKFSKEMDENSVKDAFRYDGNTVSASDLSYDSNNKTLTYVTNVNDGIHSVEILENAKSTDGKHLYGKFESRFRKGIDTNPIANPSKYWTFDENLVRDADSNNIVLHHSAAGAKYLRVSNDDGKTWSQWMPYADETQWSINDNTEKVAVQYWADNSAAYFVQDTVR
ncbi:alpha-amylase family glycosyl hydrolase [Vallitalea guaymasensis]|uniref:alpha-amylase family glycosyl hydrolase n=1 Tax=Vallitalea guaymasensis TaxID=1185412 RepID=UPI002351FC89|nr:alpha-amylase family glycosyl hydrolase [Vallitalea guaymasensis]